MVHQWLRMTPRCAGCEAISGCAFDTSRPTHTWIHRIMKFLLVGRCNAQWADLGSLLSLRKSRGFNARGQPIVNSIKECLKMLTELPDLDYVPRSSRSGYRSPKKPLSRQGSNRLEKWCEIMHSTRGWYMIPWCLTLFSVIFFVTPQFPPAQNLGRVWWTSPSWLPLMGSPPMAKVDQLATSKETLLVMEQLAENSTAESLRSNKYAEPGQAFCKLPDCRFSNWRII